MKEKSSGSAPALLRHLLLNRGSDLLSEIPWPPGLRALTLAPHPDDFDAIAVTMRYFAERGAAVHVAVLTLSPRGVEDSFCAPPTDGVKAALRQEEQRESARYFGLPDDCLTFLLVAEDANGDPIDDPENFEKVRRCMAAVRPDLVFLPHGNDTNAGHRFTFEMMRRVALSSDPPIAALLNRDPKTVSMRSDLFMCFDQGLADWKAAMLRFHRSQHQRNLNYRGFGIDERILRVNRESAARLPGCGPYAEEFEIWLPDSAEQRLRQG